jgi:hypothetical protein
VLQAAVAALPAYVVILLKKVFTVSVLVGVNEEAVEGAGRFVKDASALVVALCH